MIQTRRAILEALEKLHHANSTLMAHKDQLLDWEWAAVAAEWDV